MPEICGAPTLPEKWRKPGECRIPRTRRCANCGQETCWKHARNRCPEGRTTRYGQLQHLTEYEQTLVQNEAKISLEKIELSKEYNTERLRCTVSVSFRFTQPTGTEALISTHPGGMSSPLGSRRWRPEEELARWLTKRLGGKDIKNIVWQNERDCIPVMTRAVRARKLKKSAEQTP